MFEIKEHKVPAQHIREYARALSTRQEDTLYVSVKQYVPLDNGDAQPGDITVLASHANGFAKELYEPLWEDLVVQCRRQNVRIRSIWMADIAHQGASYVLNEDKVGNDPNLFDHSRDLLQIVNTFRDDFTRPIMGIGHSMGAISIIGLSFLHPRLLSSVVLIDPMLPSSIQPAFFQMAKMTSFRKDRWNSHNEAKAAFAKNPLTSTFDTRVVDRIYKHALRQTPTLLHTEAGAWTLTTTKHQEAMTVQRANFEDAWIASTEPDGQNAKRLKVVTRQPSKRDLWLQPDAWPDAIFMSPFLRSESRTCLKFLPHLRPSCFYLYGEKSAGAAEAERRYKTDVTGSGWGGSGGVRLGRVREFCVPGANHFVCLEKGKIGPCAEKIAEWMGSTLEEWREGEKASFDKEWREADKIGRQTMSEEWLKQMKTWNGQREVNTKL